MINNLILLQAPRKFLKKFNTVIKCLIIKILLENKHFKSLLQVHCKGFVSPPHKNLSDNYR